jgi:HK97 family phage major capsid protein
MAIKNRFKQLQDRDAAITAEMRKMSDTLAAEDRSQFTDEEDAAFKALQTESAGVQAALKVELAILDQEKRIAKIATDANKHAAGVAEREGLSDETQKPMFPAIVKRHYSLKNFTGSDKNENAYTAGRFFLAALWKDQGSIQWCRDHGVALANTDMLAQSGSDNTGGAVLVPDVLSNVIIDLREKYGVFRQNAKTWTMTSDNLTIPRRTSGVTAYFVSDGVATTESQKGWDGVGLSAKELASLVRYPITLSEDAIINMADDLAGEIGYAFAEKEDRCGFLGDGTLTYGGIRGIVTVLEDSAHANAYTTNGGSAGGVKVAAAGGTSFGATVLADYEALVGMLPEYAAPNAKWYFSRAGFAAGPQRLMDAGGGNSNQNIGAGAPMQFLGYPVVISQVLNSTLAADASAYACLFGDLSLSSAMGSRREIGVDASKDRYFEYRQIAIQGVERFDIVNHDLGSTTAAGPVVALKKAAT